MSETQPDFRDQVFLEQFVRSMENPALKARMSPAGFALVAGLGRWKMAKHLALLNEKLMEVASGRLKRLIINMPPRHGKSEFVTILFSAWYLATFPERQVIITGYNDTFAADFSKQARDKLIEFGGLFADKEGQPIEVDQSTKAKDDWGLAGHRGRILRQQSPNRCLQD
jgi:hypothetical protein